MATTTEQTIVPTLHHLTSSQSMRCLVLLEELKAAKGITYKLEIYERNKKEGTPGTLKTPFPLGKSPALTVEENGKPSTKVYQLPKHPGVLTESRLIMQFLVDTFAEGMYTPDSADDKAQDVFFQEYANYTFSVKTGFAIVFELIPALLPWGLKQAIGAMVRPIVNHWKTDIDGVVKIMEESLTEERPWFSGAKIGLADFNMLWPMDTATERNYFDAKKYPKTQAWYEKMTARPAYKSAREKGGKYDLVMFMGDAK